MLQQRIPQGLVSSALPSALPPSSPALQPFLDPLPRLQPLQQVSTRRGKVQYHVRMLECFHKLHSHLSPTRLWGYEGLYPGPVFEARQNVPVEVVWENSLPEQHIFTVDSHIHGAMPPAPAVRNVPHLHGSRTNSLSDGLPEKWFTPGRSATYHYPNAQRPATLWYHDHALGITRLNVYAGLSGFYLLRGPQEDALHLPAGDYEIPIILQDRRLDAQGQLVYSPTHDDGVMLPPGVWGPEFFGDLAVLNGAVFPYVAVEPRAYRLRLLNSSNSRYFHLFFNRASRPTDIPRLVTFHQIGCDGGFLPAPVALTHLLLAPAERADLIIDFSGMEDTVLTLSNDAPAPYPGWDWMPATHAPLHELMQIRVQPHSAPPPAAFSLPPLPAFQTLKPAQAVVTRDFILTERLDAQGHSLGLFINNKSYEDAVTETPRLNSVEIWRFINTTSDAHPMHLHLVQFQIVSRQGFNGGVFRGGEGPLQLVGVPRPPQPYEAGWKDTAVVNPGEVLTILVPFEGYKGRYVYHCHMLEHEDNDMMRPFEVVS
jgi:spore coat protein A